MITPTVGRILWYYPKDSSSELAAVICGVVSDRQVHLTVWNSNGHPMGANPDITLVQGNDPTPADRPYCTWMPYQLSQAARTAALAASKDPRAV